MEMRQYLIDIFSYNDFAFRKLLSKVKELPDQAQCIKFLSHLINSQQKGWRVFLKTNPLLK